MLDPVSSKPAPRAAHRATLPGRPRSLLDHDEQAREDLTELAPGSQVEQRKAFEIIDRIGEGGMGKIYKAYDPNMDRYVALKVLKPGVPEAFRRRFRREATIAADFSHPNLPRVLDVGCHEDTGLEWLTMEHLRGSDLGEIVDARRKVAFPLLVDIAKQTLDALDYMHIRRIVHCDVKPDNIFVTRDPFNRRIVIVKLIDFGICRSMDPPLELQREVSGDPRYMAPEQTVLNGPVDQRADLYALGITLYECITGKHPFEEWLDVEVRELLRMHCRVLPPRPSSRLDPSTPPRLAQAIDDFFAKACAKDPDARFEDAPAMKKAVAGLLDVT